jgi:hypothetical protein
MVGNPCIELSFTASLPDSYEMDIVPALVCQKFTSSGFTAADGDTNRRPRWRRKGV